MVRVVRAHPKISVKLFKMISRSTVEGVSAVSARYKGKNASIDLTPYLAPGSEVRTTKSVRAAAGGFTITLPDVAYEGDSIYGLIEPMDMVEIRMWSGVGPAPSTLPIRMRGFVSSVRRSQAISNGTPQRQITISGMDYGKIWQMYQVVYLQAYSESSPLLTTYALSELFGAGIVNAMTAANLIKLALNKILNPYLSGFMSSNTPMPRTLLDTGISVTQGMANLSQQDIQGSIYDFLRFHGDVGVWNELFTRDTESGVEVVYRANPALAITDYPRAADRKIFSDAADPEFFDVAASSIQSMNLGRSDSDVVNFFWVNNSRFDLLDEMQRKLAAIPASDSSVSLKGYQNADPALYGTRPMYHDSQLGATGLFNLGPALTVAQQSSRANRQTDWLGLRRRQLVALNKDNALLESGSITLNGGLVDGSGALLQAGQHIRVSQGSMRKWDAYVVSVDDVFKPFVSYSTQLNVERGTGFARRIAMGSGKQAPWLAEKASGGE